MQATLWKVSYQYTAELGAEIERLGDQKWRVIEWNVYVYEKEQRNVGKTKEKCEVIEMLKELYRMAALTTPREDLTEY